VADPGVLARRADAFLAYFGGVLATMPAGRFASHVEAVVASKTEASKSLAEQAGEVWGEVAAGSLDWERPNHEVAALAAITQAQLVAWYNAYIAPGGARRRVFTALVERGTSPIALAGGGDRAGGGEGEEGEDEEEDGGSVEEAAEAAAASEAAAAAETPVSPPDAAAAAVPVGSTPATDAEGGRAVEDTLAPKPAAAASAAAAEPASPARTLAPTEPPALPTIDLSLEAVTALLASLAAQLAAVPAPLGDATGAAAPLPFEPAAAAFESVGARAALEQAAAAAAASSGPGREAPILVRVAVPDYQLLRSSLPLHVNAGAAYFEAWRRSHKAE
jgi:hypothetical protein